MITVIQRYLLQATSLTVNVAASATTAATVATPVIPLSGRWTLRLRGLATLANPLDNSGSLSVSTFSAAFWNFLTASGTSLFSICPFQDNSLTPNEAFPKASGAFISKYCDIDQIVASTDQIGGVVAGLQASSGFIVSNTDAANPHPVQAIIQAIVEFTLPGAS